MIQLAQSTALFSAALGLLACVGPCNSIAAARPDVSAASTTAGKLMAAPLVDESAAEATLAELSERLSDREPEDPTEFRPQTNPPPRPATRGEAPQWIPRGPSPTESAQVRVPPDNEVTGAIQSIAAHPSNADIVYIGAVNGGIWRTADATAARPSWTPLSESLPSQSIAAIEFDPTDASRQTLIAGTGRWSNFARRGDDEIGVYHTTDGGDSWSVLGGNTLLGERLVEVAARGSTLLAASLNSGLFVSGNGGANWTLRSGTAGLRSGNVFDLAADPNDTDRFYIAVDGTSPAIQRSDDLGASWTNVSQGLSELDATTNNLRLSVGANGVVFLAIVNSGRLAAVYRSTDAGANWVAMDVPAVHPGGQGSSNSAILADRSVANRVYISGDRITSSPFTGNVVRGDFSAASGSQFSLTMDGGGGGTAPHADSRDMAFDANGDLLQSDDGGIYRRTQPDSGAGRWVSVIGNLNVMEVHDLAYDGVSDVIMIGTQDNGTHVQRGSSDPRWFHINGGDGGDAAVDDTSLGLSASYRYISSQNLGGFRRAQYSAANSVQANVGLPGINDPQFVTPLELSRVDNSRLLVGGTSNVYESVNINTAIPTLQSLGAPGANRNAMAFGAVGSPAAAYVGKNAAVFRRVGNVFVATAALPGGANTITDVAMSPVDTDIVYAVDDNQVFFSDDAGATWSDLTGNLPAISSADFRSIEFYPSAQGAQVAVGTRSGVFAAQAGGADWSLLGGGLPDVLVFDLRFVPATQSLIAGTLGRGVWQLVLGRTVDVFSDGFE